MLYSTCKFSWDHSSLPLWVLNVQLGCGSETLTGLQLCYDESMPLSMVLKRDFHHAFSPVPLPFCLWVILTWSWLLYGLHSTSIGSSIAVVEVRVQNYLTIEDCDKNRGKRNKKAKTSQVLRGHVWMITGISKDMIFDRVASMRLWGILIQISNFQKFLGSAE